MHCAEHRHSILLQASHCAFYHVHVLLLMRKKNESGREHAVLAKQVDLPGLEVAMFSPLAPFAGQLTSIELPLRLA